MSRPAWTPFERGVLDRKVPDDVHIKKLAAMFRMSEKQVWSTYMDLWNDEIWINSRYQVNIRRYPERENCPALIHLSIKRRDKHRVGPERYRDFLRIKNELVGPEYEAVELYPAMTRNVDTANQYHLYVLADQTHFPFGFRDGIMSDEDSGIGSKQHPFDAKDQA